MQSFVVWNDEIEGRLDCFFYSPKNQVSIQSKFPLVTLKDVTYNVIHPPEYKRIYAAYGYQLLRAQNVKPLGIEINSNKVFLDKDYLKGKKLLSPEIGDVLVVRSGVNTGDCAVIEKNYVDLILGADNLVCKCNDKISPFFLKTYLSLNIGRKILSLYQTGATNYHMTPENLKKIKIPLPPLSIQNQIVDIMQSAYNQKKQKEVEAEKLLDSIDDYVLDGLGITLPEVEDKRCFLVDSEEVQENRVDAYYYQPKFEEVEKALRNGKFDLVTFVTLITDLKNGVEIRKYADEGYRYLRVTDLGEFGITDNAPRLVAVTEIPEKIKLHDNSFLISRSGSLGLVSIIEEKIKDAILSSHIFKVDLDISKILPAYLEAFFRSTLGQIQFFRNNNGGIVPEISQSALKYLMIVLPPLEIQNQIAEEVKRRISEAETLKAEATSITEEAKKRVEKMVLGD